MFDLAVLGGEVVDGTGNPWFWGDVGLSGDRVAFIGKIARSEARQVIDAEGLIVAPGFIDIHSHSDDGILANPFAESKVRQGVTTEVIGNCGYSLAPLLGEARASVERELASMGIEVRWSSFGDYLRWLEVVGVSVNVAALVGHATIREAVMGYRSQSPTREELEEMKGLVAGCMEEGAFGLSTGLIYPPSSYATAEEIIELAGVVASYGGLYASHIRDEGEGLVEATREAIEVGRRSGVRVEISHHKASGPSNWGKVHKTLAMMEEARREGVDVACDVYPYTASSTGLSALLPGWLQEGGREEFLRRLRDIELRRRVRQEVRIADWDRIIISLCTKPENKRFEGKSLLEVASSLGREPFEALCELLLSDDGTTQILRFGMCEEDVETVIRHPLSSIGSDAMVRAPYGVLSKGLPHPRSYGSFPRVISRYVRERGSIRLEEAIRKMTSAPALRVGLRKRGILREGMYADIVIFDYNEIRDTASFQEPHRYPAGIRYVLVNGVVVISEGDHTRKLPGRVERRLGT